MTLEKQVVSLELAKRLKELGVKQESLFYWSYYDDGNERNSPQIAFVDNCNLSFMEDLVSAFTVAELGEMLPSNLNNTLEFELMENGLWLSCDKSGDGEWIIGYGEDGVNLFEILYANTEADARAKMLIYLLENKLITL